MPSASVSRSSGDMRDWKHGLEALAGRLQGLIQSLRDRGRKAGMASARSYDQTQLSPHRCDGLLRLAARS
jgi:hypothetical protein